MRRYITTSTLATVLSGIAFVGLGLGQDTRWIEVSNPRPIAQALDELEKAIGFPVHYEDVRYEAPEDVEDATERLWNSLNRSEESSVRLMVPRTRSLSFSYLLEGSGERAPMMERAVAALVASSNAADLPGQFAVQRYDRQGESDFFVLPSTMRDEDGVYRSTESLLATPVSISIDEVSGVQALSEILQRIREQTGHRLEIGTVPLGALARARVSISADNEPAGHVLIELIKELQAPPLALRVLFDPTVKYYAVNLHPVMPPEWSPHSDSSPTTSDGNPWFKPVSP